MHQEDHEVERRRAEFDLGATTENERIRHRFAAWMVILIIGVTIVVLGVAI